MADDKLKEIESALFLAGWVNREKGEYLLNRLKACEQAYINAYAEGRADALEFVKENLGMFIEEMAGKVSYLRKKETKTGQ